MSAELQRIAAVAHGLSKAELHILIELAARSETLASHTTVSSRELAQATGLARASVQTAIDSLNKKQLLRSDEGGASRSAVHRLICFGTTEDKIIELEVAQKPGQAGLNTELEVAQNLSQGGLDTGPGVARILSQGGPRNEPQRAQPLGQGGLNLEPALDEKSIACEKRHIERANARADSIDFDFEKTIDRLQKSQKGDFDESLFELARNQIASHHAKFARPENRLPSLPDDRITAQFLTVADWPKLETMLFDLASERKEAGHSYGWYVTVALQRIHGISPEQVREIRARLKSEAGGPAMIPVRAGVYRKPPRSAELEQLEEQIRAVAAVRSMR